MTHLEWGTERSTTPAPDEGPDHPEVEPTVRRRRRSHRRHRTLRRVLFMATLLLAVAIAGVGWVGVDAVHARGELNTAATQVHVLQSQVVKGDRKAAAATLTSPQTYAGAASEDTHGVHWSAARVLPWLGPNVVAVQTVSEVIDGLAVHALPTLMDATSLVDPTNRVRSQPVAHGDALRSPLALVHLEDDRTAALRQTFRSFPIQALSSWDTRPGVRSSNVAASRTE